MPGYSGTNANAMMKAMMLSSSWHDVRGDDTESNGFKLIVEEDEECTCQIVRALGSGRNTRVSVNRNRVLKVDTLTSPSTPKGRRRHNCESPSSCGPRSAVLKFTLFGAHYHNQSRG